MLIDTEGGAAQANDYERHNYRSNRSAIDLGLSKQTQALETRTFARTILVEKEEEEEGSK